LAWLLGDLLFQQGSPRRAILLAVSIAVLNLALPEALYALDAARSSASPKTPHGTFFSWHAQKTNDVARARQFAQSTVALVARRQAESADGVPRRLVIQMNWERSGYVQYGLAAAGVEIDVEDAGVLEPGVVLKEYTGQGISAREVRCNWLNDPTARDVVRAELRSAKAEGLEVIVAREAAALLELDPESTPLVRIF
jgi:hypothetical protein